MTRRPPGGEPTQRPEAEPVDASRPPVGQARQADAKPSPLEKPLVVTEAEREPAGAVPATPRREPEAAGRADVQVSAQIDALLAGVLSAPAARAAAERHALDTVVHRLLIVGLAASSLLMVLGLVLDVALHRQIPTTIPDLGEMVARVMAGRPSGFLSLGLLVLLATPIVRVIGSIVAFVYERDWRYAAVSLIVLLVVILSVFLGQG